MYPLLCAEIRPAKQCRDEKDGRRHRDIPTLLTQRDGHLKISNKQAHILDIPFEFTKSK